MAYILVIDLGLSTQRMLPRVDRRIGKQVHAKKGGKD